VLTTNVLLMMFHGYFLNSLPSLYLKYACHLESNHTIFLVPQLVNVNLSERLKGAV
jgi:hypothetical protein